MPVLKRIPPISLLDVKLRFSGEKLQTHKFT